MKLPLRPFSSALAIWPALAACSLSGIQVETHAVAATKPGNVAVYLFVSEAGKALPTLDADDFAIYEDEQQVPVAQTRQVLLERELVAAHLTLLLVDHSLATDEAVRNELASAVSIFLEGVRPTQSVVVHAFDGRSELKHVADFSRGEAGKGDGARLKRLAPADTSRNLNGAVVEAVEELESRLAQSGKAVRVGTIVVFAGGPDLARRVRPDALHAKLDRSRHTVIAIGFGASEEELRAIGKDGYFDAHSPDTLSLAFEEAAHRVKTAYEQHYLLAYCSPARAGTRQLRVEVRVPGEASAGANTGDAFGEFNADGFAAECDPRAVPRFETKRKTKP